MCLILAGKVGSNIASELGTMRVTQQIDALDIMGVNSANYLIDTAHQNGIAVIMDIVHSHAVKNEVEGLGNLAGDPNQYFYPGDRHEHPAWDSLCFDYGKNEVIHFLLSNCKYWLTEFHFDGFRFDGVTSMLYYSHGLGEAFCNYGDYFNGHEDDNAICYLTLANSLIHEVNKNAITIADTWLMTILWPEDGKLTWLASNERLCLHTRIFGDILSLVVLNLRKVLQRSISVGFLIIKWNLDIDHLAMSLDNSILLVLTLSLSNIQKKVGALNRMLTCFKLSEIILLNKLHHFREEWIERNISLQIV